MTAQPDDDPFADVRLARAALDAIPVALWLKDLDGRFLACNRRFEQLFGALEAELVGRPSSDFVDAETDEILRRQDRIAVSIGKPVTHEQWMVDRLDDRRKLWETTTSTVSDADGTVIGVLGISFDVTDRDEIYRQLVDETQRFEAAERLAHTGSWDEDVVAGTIRWTPGVFDIFGLDPVTTTPDRRLIFELIHPDDRDAVVRVTEEGRRHGQPYTLRYRAVIDERVKYVEALGSPQLGVDGRLLRVTGTVQDVTDRAVAAQQLTERQAEIERAADDWATLLTGNHDGFLLVDRQGRVLEVSEPFCRLSGLRPDEVVGRSMADLNPYVDEAELVAGMDAFAAAGGGVVPGVVRHADGTDIPVEVSVTFTERDGGLFFTFIRDERERVRLNVEADQNARRFRALLEASSDGVIIIGHDNRLTDVNGRYLELSGFSRDELIGTSIADLDAQLDESQLGRFRQRTVALGSVVTESTHRRSDGSLWPVEVTATATGDGTEEFFCFVRDISDRLHARAMVEQAAHRYQTLLDNTDDGFARATLDGTIFETNERMTELFGMAPGSLFGRSITELNAHRTPEATRSLLASVADRGYVEIETEARRADGSTFPVRIELTYLPVDGGHLFAFLRELDG